ncbi:hypothetical protein BJX99DRAFT_165403 [Aspergillus californicus]
MVGLLEYNQFNPKLGLLGLVISACMPYARYHFRRSMQRHACNEDQACQSAFTMLILEHPPLPPGKVELEGRVVQKYYEPETD